MIPIRREIVAGPSSAALLWPTTFLDAKQFSAGTAADGRAAGDLIWLSAGIYRSFNSCEVCQAVFRRWQWPLPWPSFLHKLHPRSGGQIRNTFPESDTALRDSRKQLDNFNKINYLQILVCC
jgi:hypothetical protein